MICSDGTNGGILPVYGGINDNHRGLSMGNRTKGTKTSSMPVKSSAPAARGKTEPTRYTYNVVREPIYLSLCPKEGGRWTHDRRHWLCFS